MTPNPSTRRRFSRRSALTSVVAAAALCAALVSGCSSEETTTAPPTGALPDGAQLVKESAKTTQTLRTVHLNIDVTNLPDLPVETVSADVTNETQGSGAAMGEAKVKIKPEDPFTEAKFLVVDKVLYTETGGRYVPAGPAEKVYDPGVILDKDKGIANVIANVQNPKAESREVIDGINTVKITGTIDAAVIDPIVPRIGQNAGTMPITLWIQDTAPPASDSTKPSDAASTGDGPNLVKAVVKKDAGEVTVGLSNWAKPVNIVKPAG
ncbi:LppX_LprAFG lipoprotein [Nocardia sp. AG03]|uniref:LppX_LprAFG lipoprotein n=1 Tax=Nocardia sp. AG03 TaxID=3025312 RepID=UPI002418742E|nr:LppX_LprAFG lipoprotein [Nocardia sp. AG03]